MASRVSQNTREYLGEPGYSSANVHQRIEGDSVKVPTPTEASWCQYGPHGYASASRRLGDITLDYNGIGVPGASFRVRLRAARGGGDTRCSTSDCFWQA